MKAAESYPIFSVQFSHLMKKLSNVAGSKAPSMTSSMIYMILSRYFVNVNQLYAPGFFYWVSTENLRKKKESKTPCQLIKLNGKGSKLNVLLHAEGAENCLLLICTFC